MSVRACAALAVGLVSACASRETGPAEAVESSNAFESDEGGWWAGAKASIEADRRRARPLDGGRAALSAADLRLLFDRRAATARSSASTWGFQLEEARRGRGGVVRAEASTPEAEGTRVVYRRGRGLVEWYENLGDAVEQGFEVAHVPGEGDLLVTGRVTSSAPPVPARDGVRYGSLWIGGARADDATGRPLPTKIEARDDLFTIRVAVEGATWPIAIDPVLRASAVWEYSEPSEPPPKDYGAPFNLGAAVAPAGDVNADGYADVVVGVPGFEINPEGADIGRAYVFLGGPAGLATAPAWRISAGGVGGANFGAAVAGAGDFNCDGFSDVIVGAPKLLAFGQPEAGRAFVYFGGPGAPMGPTELTADAQAKAHFGAAVAGVGNVDDDVERCDDVLVGAPDYDDGSNSDSGRAYLFLGNPTVGPTASHAWSGPEPGEVQGGARFGAAVAGAGDVDDDGFADALVGAPDYDDGGNTDSGRAYLFLGEPVTGLRASGWTAPDPTEAQGGARFGAALASGDVDGDGFSDILVGAPLWDQGAVDAGRVFLFLGDGGPGRTPDQALTPDAEADAHLGAALAGAGDINGDGLADVVVGVPDQDDAGLGAGGAYLLLGDAEESVWLRVENVPHPVQDGASLGAAVAGVGDVNGDGFGEIIIGAPGWDTPDVDVGRSFVFYGGSAEPSADPERTVSAAPPQNESRFGWSVAHAGDVNGDGHLDLLVGAPYYDFVEEDAGRAFLFLGGEDGLDTDAAWQATPEPEDGAQFGASLAGIGYVNGDTFADVIVGAPLRDGGALDDVGKAYVFHGDATTGLEADPAWALAAPEPEGSGRFGASVAGAGDVNGDGFGDLLIGAPSEGMAATSPGRAYVFYGSSSGLSVSFSCGANCIENPEPQLGAEFGAKVSGAGDLDGDGNGDVVVSAPLYDLSPPETDHGRAYVYYGTGEGLSSSVGLRLTPEPQAGARLGLAAAGAGDVDGDGYSDLVLGAPDFDVTGTAAVDQGRLFFFRGGLLGVSQTPSLAFTVDPSRDRHRFGHAVSGAGDVGGDGRADVLVGTTAGVAYAFSGTQDGLSALPAWSYAAALGFGEALAAGDFDGDGFSDLAVGSLAESSFQGRAHVFSGNEEGGHGRKFPPRAFLGQFDDSDAAIRIGAEVPPSGAVHLESKITNAAWMGARLGFQVEVRRVGEPFTGEATAQSLFFARAGQALRVSLVGLPAGAYRWRGRPVWPSGAGLGRWVDFGGNDGAEADFRVAWPIPPNLGIPCAVNSQCSSGFCRDGTCCESACQGVCQGCVTGTGRCTVLEGDPDDECGGTCRTGECAREGEGCELSRVGSPCGPCLACDGAGECVVPVTTGECAPDMGTEEPADLGPAGESGLDMTVSERPPDAPMDGEPSPVPTNPLDPFACDCGLAGRPSAPPPWLLLAAAVLFVSRRRSSRSR